MLIQDSLALINRVQEQTYIAMLVKHLAIYIIVPSFLVVVGSFIGNFFIGKRSLNALVNRIELSLVDKVSRDRFDESIRRAHEEREKGDAWIHKRLDDHVKESNAAIISINEKFSLILAKLSRQE